MTTHRTGCRDCGSSLETVLNLGDRYISSFPDPTDFDHRQLAPLHLTQCTRPTCGLVQLADTVDPAVLYGGDYWYRSGVNEVMGEELRSIVAQAQQYTPVKRGSVVLDIGANDGTLLSNYPYGCHRLGIDPSPTFDQDTLRHDYADDWWVESFPDADLIDEYRGKVRIITSIACVYALDDPHAFVAGIKALLAPDGLWILQFQDLAQMLSMTAFDNLCHEHLFYPTLHTIERLVAAHGMEVVHAERRAINGGSLRVIVRPHGAALVSTSVNDCRILEQGAENWETLARFSWRVDQATAQVRAAVDLALVQGPVDLYGASTKANTLLQVCGLGPMQIRWAWERSPEKWKRETVTRIPIVSEATGRLDPPPTLLLGIWQYRDTVLQREAAYLSRGGTVIVPLPEVDIARQAVLGW
jgi:hypothetical protein